MTKKKAEKVQKKTLRDVLRGMVAGTTLTWEVDKSNKLESVRMAASFLNTYEPELGVTFSCQCFPSERKAIITARKREK